MDKERMGVECHIDGYKIIVDRYKLAEKMRTWDSVAKHFKKRPGEPIGEKFYDDQHMSADRLALLSSEDNSEIINKECKRVGCYVDGELFFVNRDELAKNMRNWKSNAECMKTRPGQAIGEGFFPNQDMSADRIALTLTISKEWAKHKELSDKQIDDFNENLFSIYNLYNTYEKFCNPLVIGFGEEHFIQVIFELNKFEKISSIKTFLYKLTNKEGGCFSYEQILSGSFDKYNLYEKGSSIIYADVNDMDVANSLLNSYLEKIRSH